MRPFQPRYVGALDLHTEVPTPAGMTTLEHLAVGDCVFGSNGQPAAITEISEQLVGRRCFEIEFATGDRIVADEEQRWLTELRDVPRSASVPTRRDTLQVAGSVRERGPASLAVRVAPAVQLPSRKLTLDPYVLGVWLSAGVETEPALIGASEELVRRLRDLGARVFVTGVPGRHWIAAPARMPRGHRGPSDLVAGLKELRVLGDKHLPMTYLRAAEDQRRELLAGLLDAGGSISDGGEVLLGASQSLATGIHQLVASLGYRPWFRPRPEPGIGLGVGIGFVTGEQVFGLHGLRARHQDRRRLGSGFRPRRLVVRVRPVSSRPLRRLRVATDDGLLLLGRSFIPVPGAMPDSASSLA